MVDFRFHLVSLISVFMALSVGVILGAGPLQNSMGKVLSHEVEDLRTSREEARQNVSELEDNLKYSEESLTIAAQQLTKDVLKDKTVAFVILPGVEAQDVEEAKKALAHSGARITVCVSVTDQALSTVNAQYRDALASQVRGSGIISTINDKSTSFEILASAIDTIAREGTAHDGVSTLISFLSSDDEEHNFLSIDETLGEKAQATVLFVPSLLFSNSDNLPENYKDENKAREQFIDPLEGIFTSQGAHVVATYNDENVIKKLEEVSRSSVIDSLGRVAGAYNIAVGLTYEHNGNHIRLGRGENAVTTLGIPVAINANAGEPSADG